MACCTNLGKKTIMVFWAVNVVSVPDVYSVELFLAVEAHKA